MIHARHADGPELGPEPLLRRLAADPEQATDLGPAHPVLRTRREHGGGERIVQLALQLGQPGEIVRVGSQPSACCSHDATHKPKVLTRLYRP